MKAMVIEDSRLARHGLISMLANFSDIEIIGQAENPEQAISLIKELEPELLFLDIHLPGGTGFELLNAIHYSPKVIFTTAYSEHAIQSFEYQTVDYLLKPISLNKLEGAINKLKTASEIEGQLDDKPILEMSNKLFFKNGEQCFLVKLSEIDYFESCKNYARIFFEHNNAFIKKPLSSIEARLPKQHFFRANRQYIINLNAIKNMSEAISDGYIVTMNDGKMLEISRRNATILKERLSF
ncbi:LytR/AlgR family response regulator transcription factor [Pseudoalteromonas denitrificans]|uniref:Two component transcriptional regulator, LytTR family n=1 Tax=Pseudoalteromonas denitrificans DSM 6059 TaxID=1123010 RepID=A0A1I1V9U7_9GAMM|nr:LytTR family DNA-binding domain-containing protein [Pseudoalteromonas denitrificans]SFD77190.1 two component transcriptional regulator, LytTR family [Pseudoalteromonas denitrificans DSM 6059]